MENDLKENITFLRDTFNNLPLNNTGIVIEIYKENTGELIDSQKVNKKTDLISAIFFLEYNINNSVIFQF